VLMHSPDALLMQCYLSSLSLSNTSIPPDLSPLPNSLEVREEGGIWHTSP